jgi:hypothetical protein
MEIVISGTSTERLQLLRLSQRSRDAGLMRRAMAVSWLLRGHSVCSVSEHLTAARSSTVRRALRRTEFRWRRARPTLHQRDPNVGSRQRCST